MARRLVPWSPHEHLSRPLRALVTIAAAIAAAIAFSATTLAHGGEWGIFADPPRSWPGAGVHVRGDLPSTGPIELVLVGPGSVSALVATIDDAPNGHFETMLTLPADLMPGGWTLEARAPGMVTASAPIELVSAPPPGPDDQGGDAVAASPAPATSASVSPAQLRSPARSEIDLVPIFATGLAAAALAILLRRTRHPSPSR